FSLHRHCDCASDSSFLPFIFAAFLASIWTRMGCMGENSASTLNPSGATGTNGRFNIADYADSGNEFAARTTKSAQVARAAGNAESTRAFALPISRVSTATTVTMQLEDLVLTRQQRARR